MKKTNRILVVEDNEPLRDQIVQVLEFEGYEVLAAAHVPAGQRLATTAGPELVVSDITMPQMDGHDLLRNLRAAGNGADTPVVFLTARGARGDIRTGMDLGADDYLTKPFEMKELLNAVATRLRRRHEAGAAASRPLLEERSRMLLSLPHELRTPLNGIIGFTELLKDALVPGAPVPADTPEMLDQLLVSGTRMERLATNLVLHLHLELARQAPGQERLFTDAGPASADEQTTVVAGRVARQAGRDGDLRWRPPGRVAVAVSPHFLEKMLEELLDNAFKFSAPGTPVEVSLTVVGDTVEWQLADRGLGVTAGEAAALAPFRQWRRNQREQQGLGLGFAIARQLAEFNGGTLELAPRAGGGCTARLCLPRAGD